MWMVEQVAGSNVAGGLPQQMHRRGKMINSVPVAGGMRAAKSSVTPLSQGRQIATPMCRYGRVGPLVDPGED
jgi:hypothetical protein